jgi:hypothetical protein
MHQALLLQRSQRAVEGTVVFPDTELSQPIEQLVAVRRRLLQEQ